MHDTTVTPDEDNFDYDGYEEGFKSFKKGPENPTPRALSFEEIEAIAKADLDAIEFGPFFENYLHQFLNISECIYLSMAQKMLGVEKLNYGIGSFYGIDSCEKGDYYYILGTNFFHDTLLMHPKFPFGFQAANFERHKKIMERRYLDIKSRELDIPDFKENKRYGLNKILDFMKDKENRFNQKRPKVQARTLTITSYSYTTLDEQNKSHIINFTFLNKFENVMHPMSYFIKQNYHEDTRKNPNRYQFYRIESFFADLEAMPHMFYDRIDWYISNHFDVLCFNIFTLPLRAVDVETFLNFLLAFHKKHPNIYIKDISGRGYQAYRKYACYEELLESNIDIHVIL